ncbi:MAG: phasin family protein [Octadecabacter sp.]|nr:phasin family protein [Octadecabacter sp.]
MVANTQDFTAVMKDFMGSFPVDTKTVEDAIKTQSSLNEKLSAVSLTAAQKSTDLSAKWAQEALTKMTTFSSAKTDPADYMKSVSNFASESAEAAAEHMASFAEIAKSVQTEALELMMAVGKNISTDISSVANKATVDPTTSAKKSTTEK